MSHRTHELADDFPELKDRLHELKTTDAHFNTLATQYDEINARVHRAETNVEPMEQLAEEQLRKERAALKDQLYAMLKG